MVTLDRNSKKEILNAIRETERKTTGEICVHLKRRCRPDVLKEAKKVFVRLGMHRTRQRNGILLFVAWDSRQFAILGDAGIHEKVGEVFWNDARDRVGLHFSKGKMKEGILAGVRSAGEVLKTYFPSSGDRNELPDSVTES